MAVWRAGTIAETRLLTALRLVRRCDEYVQPDTESQPDASCHEQSVSTHRVILWLDLSERGRRSKLT